MPYAIAWPTASIQRKAAPLRTLAVEGVSPWFRNWVLGRLTLGISRKRRQKPVHVRLRQRTRRLDEEVGQEGRRVQAAVPVDDAWAGRLEPHLHHNGPDVDAQVEDDDGEEANLGPATLRYVLHVEDETETKASDTDPVSPHSLEHRERIDQLRHLHAKEWRDKRRQRTSSDGKVSRQIGRPGAAVEE